MPKTMLGWIETADARLVLDGILFERAPNSETGMVVLVLAALALLGCSMLPVSLALSADGTMTLAGVVQCCHIGGEFCG
jgi:hypothetical protein